MYGCLVLLAPKTARRATLLSPYGSALHGYHRGAQATFAEPMDVWLTVLSQAVPFFKDALLLCPSSYSPRQVQQLWRRVRQHLPEAHVATVPPPRTTAASAAAVAALGRGHSPQGKAEQQEKIVSSSLPSPATSELVEKKEKDVPRGLALRPPSTANPFQRFPTQTFDLIIFAANAFSEPHIGGGARAPFYISEAHRVLRPHGVLAITGSTVAGRTLHVTAPPYADSHYMQEYLTSLQQDRLDGLLRLLAVVDTAPRLLPDAPASVQQDIARLQALAADLAAAIGREESVASAHADLYFPFRGVQRRWLTSEFELTIPQLTEVLRGMPLYQHHRHVLPEVQERLRQVELYKRQRYGAPGGGGDAREGDFVDMGGSGAAAAAAAGAAEEEPVLGVQRHLTPVDPLEMLQHSLYALLRSQHSQDDRVRVQVQDFVLTCSNRSMNASGDAYDYFAVNSGLLR